MHRNRRAVRASSFVLALLALSGCYSTAIPVIEKGDWAPLAGEYECSKAIAGGTEIVKYTEEKSGFFWPEYMYVDAEGAETKLAEMDDGLMLVQRHTKDDGFNYAYIDFTGDDSFILSVASVMEKKPYVDALAREHAVTTGSGKEPGEIALSGDQGDILDFLMAHDKSMLSAFMSCKRL